MSKTPSPTDSSPTFVTAEKKTVPATPAKAAPVPPAEQKKPVEKPVLDPTRYGDWEKNGRCIDF